MNLSRPDSTWDGYLRKGKVHRLRDNGLTLCDDKDYDGTIVDENVKVTCKRCLRILGLQSFRKEELATTRRTEMSGLKAEIRNWDSSVIVFSRNGNMLCFEDGSRAWMTRQELVDALHEANIELPEPSKPPPLKQGDLVVYTHGDGEVVTGNVRKILMIDEKRFLLSEENNFGAIGSTRLVDEYPHYWKVVGHEDV